jgi:hypothetical protein
MIIICSTIIMIPPPPPPVGEELLHQKEVLLQKKNVKSIARNSGYSRYMEARCLCKQKNLQEAGWARTSEGGWKAVKKHEINSRNVKNSRQKERKELPVAEIHQIYARKAMATAAADDGEINRGECSSW